MLDATKHRPDVSTIYVVNIDTAVLSQQIRALAPVFADAVDANNITISLTDPTQSQIASVEFLSSNLVLSDDDISRLMQGLRNLLSRPIRFDISAGKLAASREMYEPSAKVNQTSYTVANLPA
jgi:hypothetical protein